MSKLPNSPSARSELNSAKPFIQSIMSSFGNMNQSEINKEFSKIDIQLDRKDIYITPTNI